MEKQFYDAVNTKDKQPKATNTSKRTNSGKQVLVDDSAVFIYDSGDTETYDNIHTLNDVIELHKAKPNVFIGVKPPLYSAFMNNVGDFVPYVAVGDKVRYKNHRQADIAGNPIRTVSRVYFRSISGMTVIVADFEEGDFALTHILAKVNEG